MTVNTNYPSVINGFNSCSQNDSFFILIRFSSTVITYHIYSILVLHKTIIEFGFVLFTVSSSNLIHSTNHYRLCFIIAYLVNLLVSISRTANQIQSSWKKIDCLHCIFYMIHNYHATIIGFSSKTDLFVLFCENV